MTVKRLTTTCANKSQPYGIRQIYAVQINHGRYTLTVYRGLGVIRPFWTWWFTARLLALGCMQLYIETEPAQTLSTPSPIHPPQANDT